MLPAVSGVRVLLLESMPVSSSRLLPLVEDKVSFSLYKRLVFLNQTLLS
jgi:hypothetical protein